MSLLDVKSFSDAKTGSITPYKKVDNYSSLVGLNSVLNEVIIVTNETTYTTWYLKTKAYKNRHFG